MSICAIIAFMMYAAMNLPGYPSMTSVTMKHNRGEVAQHVHYFKLSISVYQSGMEIKDVPRIFPVPENQIMGVRANQTTAVVGLAAGRDVLSHKAETVELVGVGIVLLIEVHSEVGR